jgi:CBS domain-containing protein
MAHVSEILRGRELYSVETSQSVKEVAEWMAELNVGAIVVLERGELAGVFSERDLMKRVVVAGFDPARVRVGAVMTPDPATVKLGATLDEARERMHSRNCRHLPVMDGSHVVGFLSMRDLAHHELERKTEEIHHMRAYIQGS